jgi:hypothetical protein
VLINKVSIKLVCKKILTYFVSTNFKKPKTMAKKAKKKAAPKKKAAKKKSSNNW